MYRYFQNIWFSASVIIIFTTKRETKFKLEQVFYERIMLLVKNNVNKPENEFSLMYQYTYNKILSHLYIELTTVKLEERFEQHKSAKNKNTLMRFTKKMKHAGRCYEICFALLKYQTNKTYIF